MRKAAAEYKDSFLAMVNKYKSMLEGEGFLRSKHLHAEKNGRRRLSGGAFQRMRQRSTRTSMVIFSSTIFSSASAGTEKVRGVMRRKSCESAGVREATERTGVSEITSACARRWASTEALS